jgi:hypothetical protein
MVGVKGTESEWFPEAFSQRHTRGTFVTAAGRSPRCERSVVDWDELAHAPALVKSAAGRQDGREQSGADAYC